jgi:hypothetical protein
VPPKYTEAPYVVPDTREGWVELIRTILNALVGKGYYPKYIDYSHVRPLGTPIKGFGGVASGPDPLKLLVSSLTKLLLVEEPQGITSTQIVDVFNYIGKCVVAGGVRRTAEIMFGEADDKEFISLKQDKEALKDRRWASNNSILAEIGMDYSSIAEAIALNGEPGLIWLDAMRKFGRLADPPSFKDMRVMGSNPCSEQSLESFELCCLVETFPAHHDDLADYLRSLKFAFLYAKTVTLVPTHDSRANAVMGRNKRIGCSQSGIVQAMRKLGRREYLRWCDSGYARLKELDEIYSEWLCVACSKKLTSVKPSGTVSLLCGATPGIHYPHSEYYIRNIRIQETSPLVQLCRDAGYPVEKDVYSDQTYVVSFPVKEKDFTHGKDEISIWEQFSNAAALQKHWADNQVSITVTFNKDEAKDIQTCLEIFEDQLKSDSLLPLTDHGYEQAPYITITEQQYEEMAAGTRPLDLNASVHEVTEKFCDGDSCAIDVRNES